MRKFVIISLGLSIAPCILLSHPRQTIANNQGLTVSAGDLTPITDCSQVGIFSDRQNAVRGEQDLLVPKSQMSRLEIHTPANGGIRIQGWNLEEYSVKACKAVENSADEKPKKLLKEISISFRRGRLYIHGPADKQSWAVYFIVQVPRDAAPLDLETTNGEIGLRDVSARIEAQSENGPILLEKCNGEISARTENGPIQFVGSAGDLRLDAQNGPITVQLAGKQWQGEGLEARSENGPVTVKVPDGYSSGILVESEGYSPFTCRASACNQAHGTWEEHHHSIEMGPSRAVVHLLTVNGPVSIEPEKSED